MQIYNIVMKVLEWNTGKQFWELGVSKNFLDAKLKSMKEQTDNLCFKISSFCSSRCESS